MLHPVKQLRYSSNRAI